MEAVFNKCWGMKTSSIIYLFVIGVFIVLVYESDHFGELISPENLSQSTIIIERQLQNINQSDNDRLTFERRTHCNYKENKTCYSTNKSLVVTFWKQSSKAKWMPQNILTAFPLHSYEHIIFIHDNSSWHTHPGYEYFIWIQVHHQLRLWYVKRFVTPMLSKSYEFLWLVDDDAELNFTPLHYQCVVRNLSIPLSAPARLGGALSHRLTKVNTKFINQIGRWTDFVEGGPIAILSSFAWQCIYMYLDAATGSGWGFDLVWCNIIAQQCLPPSEHRKACAILDAFSLNHQSNSINSGDDGDPEVPIYKKADKRWLSKKRNMGPLANDKKLVEFCSQ